MKRLLCAAIAAAILLLPAWACASDSAAIQDQVDELIEEIDFSYWEAPPGGLEPKELVARFASGDFSIEVAEVGDMLLSLLMADLQRLLPMAAQILIVSTLCGVLLRLRESIGAEGVAQVTEFACYLIAIMPLAGSLIDMTQQAGGAIDAMARFARALFPTLLALLAALGGGSSAGVFQPAVMAASTALSSAIRDVLIPVLLVAAALAILNHLSSRIKVEGLYKLLMTACAWGMGIAFTLFLGILTVQGAAASAFDGVTARTAKYAIDNFVPVVGGLFADTVDTLLSCSLIVKNAVGVAGLISLAAMCIQPCIAILSTIVVYKLCAALLEPVADSRIGGALQSFSAVLTMLFIAVLSVGAMFFVLVTALMNAGNTTFMLR